MLLLFASTTIVGRTVLWEAVVTTMVVDGTVLGGGKKLLDKLVGLVGPE